MSLPDLLAAVGRADAAHLAAHYPCKALDADTAGFLIPDDLADTLLAAAWTSPALSRCFNLPMTTHILDVPALDPTRTPAADRPALFGNASASWSPLATDTDATTTPYLATSTLTAHDLFLFVTLTGSLSEDASPTLTRLLQRQLGHCCQWSLEWSHFRGTGPANPSASSTPPPRSWAGKWDREPREYRIRLSSGEDALHAGCLRHARSDEGAE